MNPEHPEGAGTPADPSNPIRIPSPLPLPSQRRVVSLDLLRAAAILCVMANHGPEAVQGLGYDVHQASEFGGVGVDLFFVLSGFLIGRIVFEGRRPTVWGSLTRFWMKRWFRTLPAYFFILIVYFGAKAVFLHEPFGGKPWWFLIFAQNYHPMTNFEHSWSLCVEEQFYFTLPLVVFILRADRLPAAAWLLPAGLSLFGRAWTAAHLGEGLLDDDVVNYATRFRTHLHLDGIAAGLFLAKSFPTWALWGARRRTRIGWAGGGLVLLGATLFATIPATVFYVSTFYTIMSAGFACLLVGTYGMQLRPLLGAPVHYVALVSYSAYLWHIPAVRIMNQLHLQTGWIPVDLAFYVVLVLGIAGVSYRLVEKPFLDLRDRLIARSRARAQAAAAQPLSGFP